MKSFDFDDAESHVLAIQLAEYSTEFSNSKFWDKLKRLFKHMGEKLVYNALLLYYVIESDDVPLKTKALIVAALGYLICPVDLIPDAILVVGFSDDLAAILAVVKAVSESITPEIKASATAKVRSIFD